MNRRKNLELFIEDFVRAIPRGITSRRLSQQSLPQACWQDVELLYNSGALSYNPHDPGRKILIGALDDKLIGIDDNRHVLTVAGSRTGKSVCLIGNLLLYRGSVIATDLKGELANITARQRADLGQRVYVLDPFEICSDGSAECRASYNPLSVLRADSKTIIEDAELIADALVIEAGKDPHWDQCAKNFIEGLCLHVVSDPRYADKRNLVTVRGLIQNALAEFEDDEKEDKEDKEEIEDTEQAECADLFSEMLNNAEQLRTNTTSSDLADAIEGAALDFYEKPSKERDSVLSTLRRHTKLLDYSSMRSVLQGHDFDLADLKRDPDGVSVYLCLPASRISMCARWLRIFINQLLSAMEGEKTRPEAPVLAALDEFPVLGYMKQLEDAAGQIASFDVKLWVFLQDWSQGKALYKERWESFAANAGIMQFFGSNDLATTEYISKRLGKSPVMMVRESEATPEQRAQGLTGRTIDTQLHDLLTPEEITRQFGRDDRLKRQLVIWAGFHPMIISRVEYFDEDSPVHKYFEGKYAKAL